MVNNCGMSTYCNISITKPSKTLTDIFDVFTRYGHDNIIFFSHFLLLSTLLTDVSKCTVGK